MGPAACPEVRRREAGHYRSRLPIAAGSIKHERMSRIALTVLGAAAAADLVFVRALQPTTLTAALMLGAWLLTPYIIGGAWLLMTRRDRRFSAAAAIVTRRRRRHVVAHRGDLSAP